MGDLQLFDFSLTTVIACALDVFDAVNWDTVICPDYFLGAGNILTTSITPELLYGKADTDW